MSTHSSVITIPFTKAANKSKSEPVVELIWEPKRSAGRPRKEQTKASNGISKTERARIANNESSRRSRIRKRITLAETNARLIMLEQQAEVLKTRIDELTHLINVYQNIVCKCGSDPKSQFLALLGLQRKI